MSRASNSAAGESSQPDFERANSGSTVASSYIDELRMRASGVLFVGVMDKVLSIAFLLRNADCRSFAVVMSRHKGLGRPVCYHRQQA